MIPSTMTPAEVSERIRVRRADIEAFRKPPHHLWDHEKITDAENEIVELQHAAMRRCTSIILRPVYYGHLAEQLIIDWARASYGMETG